MFHINFHRSPYAVKNMSYGKPSPHLHHHRLPPRLALQVSNVSLTRWNGSVRALINTACPKGGLFEDQRSSHMM